jgi:hypothetical protein
MNRFLILAFFLPLLAFAVPVKPALAGCCPPPATCPGCNCSKPVGECMNFCVCVSEYERGKPSDPLTTMGHITDEFRKQRIWIVEKFFKDDKPGDHVGLLGAMQLMTSQLVATGMQQVEIIGTFFDAKHQLETQRLFQEMTARAHKDYQPSEELCNVGTASKSLYASSRNNDLTASVFSRRTIDRQLLAKDAVGSTGRESDLNARLVQFVKKYCNPKDNAGELEYLCKKSENKKELFNKDVNFTSTLETPLSLKLDFTAKDTENSDDEQALFALTSNLFAHEAFPFVSANSFVKPDGKPDFGKAAQYLDARALVAKRSVAANSIGAIAALKSEGDKEARPFIYALMKELGGDAMSETDIKEYLGEDPSYFAQMEILSKKLYQTPAFYAGLYDKPANVQRKEVALQAITLMQKRDLYRSYLRSEMVLAVMLEAALEDEINRVMNETSPMRQIGREANTGGKS